MNHSHDREERKSSSDKKRSKSILKNGSSAASGGHKSNREHKSSSQRHSRHSNGDHAEENSSPRKSKGSKSRSASDIYDTPRVSSSVKWREDLTAAYEMSMAGRYTRRGSSVENGKTFIFIKS